MRCRLLNIYYACISLWEENARYSQKDAVCVYPYYSTLTRKVLGPPRARLEPSTCTICKAYQTRVKTVQQTLRNDWDLFTMKIINFLSWDVFVTCGVAEGLKHLCWSWLWHVADWRWRHEELQVFIIQMIFWPHLFSLKSSYFKKYRMYSILKRYSYLTEMYIRYKWSHTTLNVPALHHNNTATQKNLSVKEK